MTHQGLRNLARKSRCAEQTRCLSGLAAIYAGSSLGEAARISDTGLQTTQDWVLRFNMAGPAGLIMRKPPGKSAILNAEQRQAVFRIVDAGPMPAICGVVRWRLMDLVRWLAEEHGVAVSVQTLSRELRVLGLHKPSVPAPAPAPCAEAGGTSIF